MRVTVVGLGKLGLPLAGFYASRGHDVTGLDTSDDRVTEIRALGPEIGREPGLGEALGAAARARRWRATTDSAAAIRGAQVIVVIVPVHASSTTTIDFSMLDAAVDTIGTHVEGGTLIVVETTVPAGTTRARILPALERKGKIHGRDFFLAYSPERVAIGRVFADLAGYPKIVGGIDDQARRHAIAFYREGLGMATKEVAGTDTAEFVKLIEETYRDSNIALANSFARAADALGIDIVEAIDAANSEPQSRILQPGLGVGGNCIPVYPYLYAASAPVGSEMALAARRLNDEMVRYGLDRLRLALNGRGGGTLRDRRVLIVGVTYRRGVKDTTNSSALALLRALHGEGAVVLGADPLLSDDELTRLGFVPARAPRYADCDAIVLQTAVERRDDVGWIERTGCKVVLDGRNSLDRRAVEALGVRYVGIGR